MDTEPARVRVLYGAAEIAKYLKKLGLPATKRRVFHWLERGHLKGATKLGAIHIITERNLLANFEPDGGSKSSSFDEHPSHPASTMQHGAETKPSESN
jgi:hypothetical protein